MKISAECDGRAARYDISEPDGTNDHEENMLGLLVGTIWKVCYSLRGDVEDTRLLIDCVCETAKNVPNWEIKRGAENEQQ